MNKPKYFSIPSSHLCGIVKSINFILILIFIGQFVINFDGFNTISKVDRLNLTLINEFNSPLYVPGIFEANQIKEVTAFYNE